MQIVNETKLSKREQMKQIYDEENLQTPAESVEFLEYVTKHQQKVELHKRRMISLSKFVLAVGVCALSFMAYRYYVYSTYEHRYSGRNHKLGASKENEVYSQTFSALSVMIWGMVVAKAKAGMEASTKSDASTVGSLVTKVGTFCALIAAASLFQLMAAVNTANPIEAVSQANNSHKLMSSLEESHPDSFYDESSSHYMGGAHNVLINYAKDSMSGKSTSRIASQESMGGAHNVAMAVLVEKSNEFKRNQRVKKSNFYFPVLSAEQYKKNLADTSRFVAFIATLALCVASFVTVKTYHAHLEKHDQLISLLKNPNARVAAGEQGKKVLAKVMAKTVSNKVDEESDSEKIANLLLAAKYKNALKQAHGTLQQAHSEALLTGYQAPKMATSPAMVAAPATQIVTNYKLVEAVEAPQPMQQYWYPQNFEVHSPLPVPQMVQQSYLTKMAIQPEPVQVKQPSLADMPKDALIKALLLQLSKEM